MSYSIFNTQYLKTNNAKYVQPLLSRDPGYIFTSIAVPNYLYLQHLTGIALAFVLTSVNCAFMHSQCHGDTILKVSNTTSSSGH